MSDINMMKDMLSGLRSRMKNMEADRDIFLKLSGINEEIERAYQDKDKIEEELIIAKGHRDSLQRQKADSVASIIQKISDKMNTVLPFGEAVFSYEEDDDEEDEEDDKGKRGLRIGWKSDGVTTPYNGLSGSEKQMFDAALAHLLNANIIVLEAAELDSEHLQAVLAELAQLDYQVIVNTCHPIPPENIPEPFVQIEV